MPEYPLYMQLVRELRDRTGVPANEPLLQRLEVVAARWRVRRRHIKTVRLAAALVSFVDDYEGPFPGEIFPEARVLALLEEIAAAPAASLDVAALLALPSLAKAATFIDAVIIAHAAVRILARGRDVRAVPGYQRGVRERVRDGAAIAPFPEELARGGDALGDTYHYLANLAVGLAVSPRQPLTWCTAATFSVGPELMRTIRQGVFGSVLFHGNHARIDRAGLCHGLRLR